MEDLQELILLEQLKNTLPDSVVTYIQEKQVSRVTDAARLADEFVLTIKVFLVRTVVVEILAPEGALLELTPVSFGQKGQKGFQVKQSMVYGESWTQIASVITVMERVTGEMSVQC